MSKTRMIAQREYLENMRTKTFWIGVLAAPVGIVVVYLFMFLLANKTDLRQYAVLDYTGDQWFSKAVDKDLSQGEFAKVYENLAELRKSQKNELSPPETLAKIRQQVEAMDPAHPIRDLIQKLDAAGLLEPVIKAEGKANKLSKPAQEGFWKVIAPWGFGVMVDETKRDKVTSMIASMAMKDYVRVPFEEQGEDSEKTLNQMLRDEKIFAYFVIHDPIIGKEGSKYVSNNVTDFKLRSWYSKIATRVLRANHIQRLRKEKGLSKTDVADIKSTFRMDEKKISDTGEEEDVKSKDKTRQFAPLVFVYVLWIAIVIAAQMLLTNTVEEKSNRIIEVLLSSVSPTQLMHGKIYGIALTGLTIIGSWGIFLIAGIKLAPALLPESAATQFAEFGLDQIIQDPVYLGSFLAYFLSGYLFYAAVLVAMGSVCSSLKEAQNLLQPVMFALFVPFVTMFPITQDPNGTLAKIITYIPLYTPFAMMNRAGGPPPLWEYVASSAIILVSLWLAFKAAAKVFRVGVLMTGKPPRIREIWGWLRAPVK